MDGAKQQGGPRHYELADVLGEEYAHIAAQRSTPCVTGHIGPMLEQRHQQAAQLELSALCLSGGGIRSATFSLGIVQCLAGQHTTGQPLLEQFDYLSTVSGGGYVGSFLSAWIHNRGKNTSEVAMGLARPDYDAKVPPRVQTSPEATEVAHLRRYTRYLSPRAGLLSLDAWTLVAIYLRNLVLNFLVLGPVFLAVLLVPRFTLALYIWISKAHLAQPGWSPYFWTFVSLGVVSQAMANAAMHSHRPSSREGETSKAKKSKITASRIRLLWLVPQVAAAASLSVAWLAGRPADGKVEGYWCILVVASAFVLTIPIVCLTNCPATRKQWLLASLEFAIGGLAATVALGCVIVLVRALFPNPPDHWVSYTCLAIPAYLAVALAVQTTFQGLGSKFILKDNDREYAARTSAWLLRVMVVWVVMSAVVLYVPSLSLLLLSEAKGRVLSGASLAGVISLGLSWSGLTPGTPDQVAHAGLAGRTARIILALAAPCFIIVLAVAAVLGTDALLSLMPGSDKSEQPRHGLLAEAIDLVGANARLEARLAIGVSMSPSGVPTGADARLATLLSLPHRDPVDSHAESLMRVGMLQIFACGGCLMALAVIAGYFVNVNRFSLQDADRNRLIRAYLGASNTGRERRGDFVPFTGLADSDDLPLHKLVGQRPFHVINVALNLVKAHNLAWQERKATSFTFSPLHCGSGDPQIGYRSSRTYAIHPDGAITLGTAMAISGAAVSPNMGYQSSPVLALLMTLFNIRLGAWLGNPRRLRNPNWRVGPSLETCGRRTLAHFRLGARQLGRAMKVDRGNAFRRSTPVFANLLMLEEAMGLTDETHRYVYLSDGGHFENLGVYEMLQRRCRYIVAVDADEDPDMGFENLGGLVRRAYADLGVTIEFPGKLKIQPRKPTPETPEHYAAVGRIRYGSGEPEGKLLYIKPAFYGTEPIDVYQYAKQHDEFPHQSTVFGQFFSESQFESYRRLGYFIMKSLLNLVKNKGELEGVIDGLEKQLKPVGIHSAFP